MNPSTKLLLDELRKLSAKQSELNKLVADLAATCVTPAFASSSASVLPAPAPSAAVSVTPHALPTGCSTLGRSHDEHVSLPLSTEQTTTPTMLLVPKGIALGCGDTSEGDGLTEGAELVGLGCGPLSLVPQFGLDMPDQWVYIPTADRLGHLLSRVTNPGSNDPAEDDDMYLCDAPTPFAPGAPRVSLKYPLPQIGLDSLYKLGARRELKLGVGPIECAPMELALHSPVGDVVLQRATRMYNPRLMALPAVLNAPRGEPVFVGADIRRIHNGFALDDPDLRRFVRLTFRLGPVQCARRATLLGDYDGSIDDDPESGFTHLDAPLDRAVGRVGQALAAAAALREDAVGAAGGGLLAWVVAAGSALTFSEAASNDTATPPTTCSTDCPAASHCFLYGTCYNPSRSTLGPTIVVSQDVAEHNQPMYFTANLAHAYSVDGAAVRPCSATIASLLYQLPCVLHWCLTSCRQGNHGCYLCSLSSLMVFNSVNTPMLSYKITGLFAPLKPVSPGGFELLVFRQEAFNLLKLYVPNMYCMVGHHWALSDATTDASPRPCFILSNGCSMSSVTCWKPPWPFHPRQDIRCVPATALQELLTCLMMLSVSMDGCALIQELVQRKCGGKCQCFLLEVIGQKSRVAGGKAKDPWPAKQELLQQFLSSGPCSDLGGAWHQSVSLRFVIGMQSLLLFDSGKFERKTQVHAPVCLLGEHFILAPWMSGPCLNGLTSGMFMFLQLSWMSSVWTGSSVVWCYHLHLSVSFSGTNGSDGVHLTAVMVLMVPDSLSYDILCGVQHTNSLQRDYNLTSVLVLSTVLAHTSLFKVYDNGYLTCCIDLQPWLPPIILPATGLYYPINTLVLADNSGLVQLSHCIASTASQQLFSVRLQVPDETRHGDGSRMVGTVNMSRMTLWLLVIQFPPLHITQAIKGRQSSSKFRPLP